MIDVSNIGDYYKVSVKDEVLPLSETPYIFGYLVEIECTEPTVCSYLFGVYSPLFRVVIINDVVVKSNDTDNYKVGGKNKVKKK